VSDFEHMPYSHHHGMIHKNGHTTYCTVVSHRRSHSHTKTSGKFVKVWACGF